MKTVSILVVDDEPNNFDVIEGLMNINSPLVQTDIHYHFNYASSGQKAIDGLSQYQPDLIILDVMMPGIDGLAVCQKIKQMPRWNSIPIIMVTALTSKSTLARCLQVGADDFLSKPVNGLELRARVNSMLRIKHQFDNIQALSRSQENVIHCLDNTLKVLRGNLVSTLAHELNTPVQGIVGMIDLLTHYRTQMKSEEVSEILGTAKQSAQRLEALIKKILLYLELEIHTSRQETITANPTTISARSLIRSIETCVTYSGRQSDISINVEEADVNIPQNYLSTILQELVDNALKFSLPKTEVLIHSYINQDHIKLLVKDQGRGMTQQQISNIGAFMQFERNHYEQQGIGIGLKMVKKILDLVGGGFSISSECQKNTVVTVTLPLFESVSSPELDP